MIATAFVWIIVKTGMLWPRLPQIIKPNRTTVVAHEIDLIPTLGAACQYGEVPEKLILAVFSVIAAASHRNLLALDGPPSHFIATHFAERHGQDEIWVGST
jgi:hypothetical protein